MTSIYNTIQPCLLAMFTSIVYKHCLQVMFASVCAISLHKSMMCDYNVQITSSDSRIIEAKPAKIDVFIRLI